jgi:hypothetical protein
MLRSLPSYRATFVAIPFIAIVGCGGISKAPVDAFGSSDSTLGDASLPPDTVSLFDSSPVTGVDAETTSVDLGTASDAGIDLGTAVDVESDLGTAIEVGTDIGKPPQLATMIVLPDTQYYASSFPSVFTGQTDFIVSKRRELNIAAVLHVGDLVDADIPAQWTVANSAMRELDNVVPYVVVPGNHDYSSAGRNSTMSNYFAPSSMPWLTGTMMPGQIDNSYALMDIGPQKWLVLGLEFGPRDSVLAWANQVLKDPRYVNYPVILVTHAYLYSDGSRYDIKVGGTDSTKSNYQYWNPQYYGFTASEGINDGEAIWQKLVLPNSNVRLIFCGHMTGWSRLSSVRPDGTSVHQILSDYQWLQGENFGFGYLRVVQLDYDNKKIQVRTFSPFLNAYLEDDPNQFTLDLNL